QRIEVARQQGAYANLADLARRAELDRSALQALAAADALRSLAGHRRAAAWVAATAAPQGDLLRDAAIVEPDGAPALGAPAEAHDIVADYQALGLSLHRHPLALLRAQLARQG